MSMDYETLSVADQLLLARDLLRAKESDHFRLTLVEEPNTAARIEQLAAQIEELKGKVADLEKEQPDASAEAVDEQKPARRTTRSKK